MIDDATAVLAVDRADAATTHIVKRSRMKAEEEGSLLEKQIGRV